MKFVYQWTHTPTGTTGERIIELDTFNQLLNLVNGWNSSGKGLWVYVAVWS
jgi:hypothetical protein